MRFNKYEIVTIDGLYGIKRTDIFGMISYKSMYSENFCTDCYYVSEYCLIKDRAKVELMYKILTG